MDTEQKIPADYTTLETKTKDLHDLLSMTAHQMRTSLSATKWIFEMLLDGDVGPLPPQQKQLIEKGRESNQRMIMLVSDLLDTIRAQDTTLQYKKESVDMIELIDQILFDFSSESFKRGVELIFLKPSSLPILHTDREKIRIVIQNLIENAIKYSDTGTKVFLTIEQEAHSLLLSVKDNGIGITKEDQEHIFTRFFRSTNAQKKESMGTGLGLAITKTISEGLGGTITFESTEGEGTTFFVRLPL